MHSSLALKDKWPQRNERPDEVISQHDNVWSHRVNVIKNFDMIGPRSTMLFNMSIIIIWVLTTSDLITK